MVRLTRVMAGLYTYKIRTTVFEIERNDERDSSWFGEWLISWRRETSDPFKTLADCRRALVDMELYPDKYGIK